ncbi:hypothetical protein CRE_16051 [Caenorhabditis remanei]|uniref:Uncharacterized protein n=1 Tax=Caenorhabditis remanei TaxID=31234 RepID=E3MBJ7_CAERE|nr:hypothetical protein CRE_16051 [Caenorhabditis remanei]
MLLTRASSLLQLVTWSCSIPSLILNILLTLAIRRERRTDNRFRWFNSIFLYSVYSNTLLSIFFPLFHPTFVPARGLIYIVFIGPLAGVMPMVLVRIAHSLLLGLITYQACISPITLVLRWLVARKYVLKLRSDSEDTTPFRHLSCTALYYKNVRVLFAVTAIPFPVAIELYMNLVEKSEKLNFYTEKSHENAVWKLTKGSYPYIVIDWNFLYLMLTFTIPYLIFFLISLLFHRFYMKSIRNVPNDSIDMGYNDASTINQTLLSMALQNFVLISLPHLFLDISVFIHWQLGVRALPVTFGCILVSLTNAATLFIHFRAYRRQVGFLFIEFLRHNNVNIPLFVMNQQQQSTHFQMSVIGGNA